MVNENALRLLDRLKQASGPVSGTALARELGISRVALWKRFESLRASGYPVVAGHAGYQLGPGDKPLPWEFPGDEGRVFHFDTLGSTMDEARDRGLAGLTEGAVVAEHQSAGRGRADRSWASAGGDLLVTLILRPRLPTTFAGALGLEALAALVETLANLYALDLTLKWPNDVMAGDQKVAGVLVEAWGSVEAPQFYTVGLGLNVHGLPALARPVASVESLVQGSADRRAILAQWWSRLRRWSQAPDLDPGRWKTWAGPQPRLRVETFDGRTVSGPFQGFDRTGSLLLGPADSPIPIRYGEGHRTSGVSP